MQASNAILFLSRSVGNHLSQNSYLPNRCSHYAAHVHEISLLSFIECGCRSFLRIQLMRTIISGNSTGVLMV